VVVKKENPEKENLERHQVADKYLNLDF